MTVLSRPSAVLGLSLAFLLALAQARPLVASEAETLRCTFASGTSLAYSSGVYETSPASPLAFDITGIDLEGQRATLRTASGKGELKVVRAVNANHFIEVVNEGFLNLTTVYDIDPRRQAHPAVHSRHLGLLGEPVVAQYHGFCTPG